MAGRVGDDSSWSALHCQCHVLFPDELFADLFQVTDRRSVPPRISAPHVFRSYHLDYAALIEAR